MLTFSPSTLQFLSVPCSSGISSLFSVQCLSITFLISPPKGISSLLSAPQHYISYQSLTKEFHSYFQPLHIKFLISPSQRNFILTFSPSILHFYSVPRKGSSSLLSTHHHYNSYQFLSKEFHSHFQPLNITFLVSPLQRNFIHIFTSAPQHYISYQSLPKEFHPYFQPLHITFLIIPLQMNFILTFSPQHCIPCQSLAKKFYHYFSPSTLHFLSVPCKEISFLFSAPQHSISYQPLTKEFHPYFQSLRNITLLISHPQRNFILTFSPSILHFLSRKRISSFSTPINTTLYSLSVPRKGISSLLSAPQHYISY